MKILVCLITAVFAGFLIVDPNAAQGAVRDALSDCLEVIIPSLFAFTALSVFLQKSGLYRTALKPLTFPLSKLLRMDEELCGVFVLANIGGYPVGIKLLSGLSEAGRISKEDAGRMMCCCFASGPAFVVGLVGGNVFGSVKAGLLLFAAGFLSSLFMAGIVRLKGEIRLAPPEKKHKAGLAEAFVSSVTDAAKVMFTVCSTIVIFAALTAVLRETGIISAVGRLFPDEGIFPALLEITRIKELAANRYTMPLCAALLSMGGVCVGLQITALAKGIPLKKFIVSRAAAAGISALFAIIFAGAAGFSAGEIQVMQPAVSACPFTANALISVCVLAMSGIVLAESHNNKV